MQFSEIDGFNTIKQQLIRAKQNNKTAHAQLFLGSHGGPSLAIALAYATYLHCENKQENDSCGQCHSCVKMKKYVHPDMHFIFPATAAKKATEDANPLIESWRTFAQENYFGGSSEWAYRAGLENKQLSIPAESVRSVMKRLSLKAFESEHKVVIIWQPEYMNTTAANAMLKVLEEPTDGTVFILVAYNIEKILTTIKSRCQLMHIPAFSDDEVQQYLKKEYPSVGDDIIHNAVQFAEGNIQLAISKVTGDNTDFLLAFRNWMRLCYTANFAELITFSDEFQQMGKRAQQDLLQFALAILRSSLYELQGVTNRDTPDKAFVQGFAKTLSEDKIIKASSLFNDLAYHMERNASPKISFMNVSIQLATIFKQS
ncbi:MAG: ATP-binding protein [Cyclobacteriaceae bacterium]